MSGEQELRWRPVEKELVEEVVRGAKPLVDVGGDETHGHMWD